MEQASNINWEFKTITEHTLDILIIVDQNQIVKYVTPSFETILGYSSEEFVGKNAFDLVHPEDRHKLIASHNDVVLFQQPKIDEYRVFHHSGELKYLESRVMPVQNQPDNLVVVSIRDITMRKRLETELENRKNRYQFLQNKLKSYSQDLSTIMKVSDLNNRLISELLIVIPQSEPILNLYNRETDMDTEELPKLTIGKLQFKNEKVHILIGERKNLAYILSINASSINEPMDTIWFETMVYYTVMVFESLNVIENLMKKLETALQSSERPQWILRLLFNLSEKQRMELSSDLHDAVLQNQMILHRNLEEIIKEYSFENEVDYELKEIVNGLLNTIYQINMTCNELRPPLLRELGLIGALQNLFDYTQGSSNFNISFTTENTDVLILNEEKMIGIYRVVQELLNNAAKHSKATLLRFHILTQKDEMQLHYEDNGKGFRAKEMTPSFKSMGLSGMRERIRSLEGTIDFQSQPGNGVSVKMRIPMGS